jgi:hypothetical protein
MKFKDYLNEAVRDLTAEYTIMDMGKSHKVDIEMIDAEGKKTNVIPRFGVWKMRGTTAVEVVETSNDIKKLKKKYRVPDERVFRVK